MRKLIAVMVAMTLATTNAAFAAQQSAAPAIEAAAFHQMAAGIPLGSRVRVQTTAGKRLTATLMNVTDEAIVVKRESRVPEPALSIRFEELASLKRQEPRGIGLGKALGIGLAAGGGAMLTLFLIILSIED
jgi:hypothetical protein